MADTIRKNVDVNLLGYYDGKIKNYVDNKVGTGGLTIDSELSSTSENPVQNKVINSALEDKANTTDLTSHTSNTSNPHNVTKSQVGLGNVPNVATNDQTPSYTETTSLTKLSSGEKLSVAFGKISKAITDLISHIGDTVLHITSTERTNWNAAKTHADSAHDYLPLSGGAMTGNISYKGTKATLPMIKFVDNTLDSYGNGIVIGGGGLTIIGGGESSSVMASQYSSGSPENMVISNDGVIDFYTNCQSGIDSAKHITMNSDGTITANGFNGNATTSTTSNKLKSTSYTTITINTTDWTTNSNGGYMCTKTLDNAMPYENFNFDVVLSTDQAAAKLQIEAWNCVIADGNITQTTSNGSTTAFTFYAFTTQPSVALTIAVQGVS